MITGVLYSNGNLNTSYIFFLPADGGDDMADERARATVRLPQEAYDQLCRELTGFSTDTARFQFVVQFYLDYKAHEHLPGAATDGPETDSSDEHPDVLPDVTDARSTKHRPDSRETAHRLERL
jgi:hypothetical protein